MDGPRPASVEPELPAESGLTSAGGCFHCGEALPPQQTVMLAIKGCAQPFCCAGCAAAASWIESAGLGAYYRMRDADTGPTVGDDADVALFERSALIERLARPGPVEGQLELGVRIEGMQCAACSWLVQRLAAELPTVHVEQLDALSGRAVLRFARGASEPAELARRLARLGYRLLPRSGVADQQAQLQTRRKRLLRLSVAGLGMMQAMMFAWPLYGFDDGDMPNAVRDFFRWVGMLVTAPVVIYAGWPFFEGAWRELRLRRLGMDTPIALAVALAFGGSVVATFLQAEAVYFDSVAMFVFFLLVGRSVEISLRERVAARMAGLAEQLPASVRRRQGADFERVGLIELELGDEIALGPGETVPVDGELLSDQAQVSEAFLSGESRPLQRHRGQRVLAGSSVLERPIELRVSAVGEATALGELERLIARASQGRADWTRLADRAAQAFALIVIAAAVATVVLWSSSSPEVALSATVAVLAAACPCALSLALPTALSAATRALAERNVLMVRAGGLERLASIDLVVFDKTGTLTGDTPELQVTALAGDDPARLLAVAAALERGSLHPLARAFQPHDLQWPVIDPRETTGEGVEGRIEGRHYRLGRASFAGQPDDGQGDLWLSCDGVALARFAVQQRLRSDAAQTIGRLRALQLPVVLLSGDHPAAVTAVARSLQIDDYASELRPDDKLARLQQLQQQGRRVLMVGDGMNDAPILAAAHASLALAQGADLARQQADGVLASARLGGVVDALLLARRARAVIAQNLFWACSYNLVAVPAAALGLVSPWLAAIGMSASSALVIGSAMRLLRSVPPIAEADPAVLESRAALAELRTRP